jgi:hypothetical protein
MMLPVRVAAALAVHLAPRAFFNPRKRVFAVTQSPRGPPTKKKTATIEKAGSK